jgi:release factor glutamine methyltransferase
MHPRDRDANENANPNDAPAGPPAAPPPGAGNGDDTWTVGRLLTWTAEFLGRKGAEFPRLDAEVLLAHVLKCERVKLYVEFTTAVSERDRASYRELVRRRAEGAPVAHLVGKKEFFSLALAVNRDVLIPRPDTETLVVEFLTRYKGREGTRAVDVGTGSGAIALACLTGHPSARFHAIDRSAAALAVARANAETHRLAGRLTFHEGDLLEPVAGLGPFDAILSNPPYIPTARIAELEPGVRDHEPHLALDGGADGLDVVRRLVAQAVPLLAPGGALLLEIGSTQEAPVRAILADRPELEVAPTVRDAANHPRVVRATRREG